MPFDTNEITNPRATLRRREQEAGLEEKDPVAPAVASTIRFEKKGPTASPEQEKRRAAKLAELLRKQ